MLLTNEERDLEEKKNHRRIVEKCSICNGTGFVSKIDEHGYEQSYPCSCLKKVNRNVKLLDWGIPRKFLSDKWDINFIKDKNFYEPIKKYLDNYLDNYDEGKGLFLSGPQGRGKTTIESIIAKFLVTKPNPDTFDKHYTFNVAFSMYDDLLKWQFDKNCQDKMKFFIYKSDWLVIDNVGNEMGRNDKQFSQRFLEMILRKRDNDCKPVIISSNYTIDEIGKEYNNDIRDFIIQNNEIINVLGDNHRIEKYNIDDDFDF